MRRSDKWLALAVVALLGLVQHWRTVQDEHIHRCRIPASVQLVNPRVLYGRGDGKALIARIDSSVKSLEIEAM